MSNQTAFIQPSPKYRDAYEVVVVLHDFNDDRSTIPCANLATARSVRDNVLAGNGLPRPLPLADGGERAPDLERSCGCLTGGLGYTPAVTWSLTGRVERVHNWATARKLAGDHPACHALV